MSRKAEQKIVALANSAAQFAKDEKYREATDAYKKLYSQAGTSSPYRWFALLAVFSILGQKDSDETPADISFFEAITKDKKEPVVHKAQALFCLGRQKYEKEKDRDAAIAIFKQVVKIYDNMSRVELKQKIMNGGNQNGPTFTTVGAYRDDKDGAYNFAIKFLIEVNANWESPRAKKRAAAAQRTIDDSDNENGSATTTTATKDSSSNSILLYSGIAIVISYAIYAFWPKTE
ncbi:UNVERIFIED_CONTAM: hypothetical protein HDU68_010795 [Siphonaria sp. JEL0065]|nr:hypothetical protein HDU68_010795 [Siphonaria sp. JEL0065]